jgi:hypothetical protein
MTFCPHTHRHHKINGSISRLLNILRHSQLFFWVLKNQIARASDHSRDHLPARLRSRRDSSHFSQHGNNENGVILVSALRYKHF